MLISSNARISKRASYFRVEYHFDFDIPLNIYIINHNSFFSILFHPNLALFFLETVNFIKKSNKQIWRNQ